MDAPKMATFAEAAALEWQAYLAAEMAKPRAEHPAFLRALGCR
jgi:hypothetical protein